MEGPANGGRDGGPSTKGKGLGPKQSRGPGGGQGVRAQTRSQLPEARRASLSWHLFPRGAFRALCEPHLVPCHLTSESVMGAMASDALPGAWQQEQLGNCCPALGSGPPFSKTSKRKPLSCWAGGALLFLPPPQRTVLTSAVHTTREVCSPASRQHPSSEPQGPPAPCTAWPHLCGVLTQEPDRPGAAHGDPGWLTPPGSPGGEAGSRVNTALRQLIFSQVMCSGQPAGQSHQGKLSKLCPEYCFPAPGQAHILCALALSARKLGGAWDWSTQAGALPPAAGGHLSTSGTGGFVQRKTWSQAS
ncbi:PREDICTED: uncharacterized protein LOC107532064 [Miniopterus natalensis]|uniref:uncharacterized protein LOC107532064 n=1 Tax=Miniopterus natalensis TaxID=291302 RepID=UPI0007A6C7CE|nr:PREDICTED: uncharacterized protein LOC107532064 [Miniopterus natalensis]